MEVELVFQGPSELSAIERCPFYIAVCKKRFHCKCGDTSLY